jgi:ABC-type sugar transport system ATPase subunit
LYYCTFGVDINNKLVSVDLSEPESCHVLGAGTTGSGKSVFLQSLLLSLVLERSPSECQVLICDPKRVTFKRSVKDIRSCFQSLADYNYRIVRGSEENLEFSVN